MSSSDILPPQWLKGPTNDQLIEAHSQPIIALATNGTDLVTASTDHSLKVFDLKSGKKKRELYTKQFGHTEWVNCVDYAADGRILSGGMDSKLCLWHDKLVKCDDLVGHRGSISQITCGKSDSTSHLAISASYDKTLKVWDLNAPSKQNCCVHTLYDRQRGHTKAVQNFFWNNSLVISGGRDGLCCVWDINSAKLVSLLEQHVAPVSCVQAACDDSDCGSIVVTGGMDGYVNIWDMRTGKMQYKLDAVNGSVNDIKITNGASPTKILVAGSDKKIHVCDPKMNFKVVKKLEGHKDVITQMCVVETLVLSGGGNGWVLVHDLNSEKCLYGVGASEKGMCRCVLALPPNYFVAAGDDGNAVIFSFN